MRVSLLVRSELHIGYRRGDGEGKEITWRDGFEAIRVLPCVRVRG